MIFSALWIFLLPLIPGCVREDMDEQAKNPTESSSEFFSDGSSARPLIDGTVARGMARLDSHLYEAQVRGKLATTFPTHYPTETDGPFPTRGPALRDILERGRRQYTIYCALCHGQTGDGDGMIVRRGFNRPPSYQIDRLRTAPVGRFFVVITDGFGAMYGYGDRVSPADRWAIVAYIRALQMSQATPADQLEPADAQELKNVR